MNTTAVIFDEFVVTEFAVDEFTVDQLSLSSMSLQPMICCVLLTKYAVDALSRR